MLHCLAVRQTLPFMLHCPAVHSVWAPPPFCGVQVQYYGLIKQSTGEDWENAKISLSTAQPAIGGGAPTLPTKIIRFQRPIPAFNSYLKSAAAMNKGEQVSMEFSNQSLAHIDAFPV